MAISLPDTAFAIACYRANHEHESRDPFAHLWVKPGVQKWVDVFKEKVSEYDEILHCMRNRFFHDTLKEIEEKESDLLCLNLGAGFSMYPYSMAESTVTIEADFNDVIEYKQLATDEFVNDGSLPNRNVMRKAADITNRADQVKIQSLLKKYPNHRKVVMIEGVFFFLNWTQIHDVIEFCAEILSKDDVLLTVSFDTKTASTAVFNRLISYFENELHSEGNNTTVPHEFYSNLPEFTLKGTNSSLEMARQFNLVPYDLQEESVLNEYCYYLIRK